MNVGELQTVLKDLEAVYEAGGAKKQASSIAQLSKALLGDAEMPVEQMVAALRAKLAGEAESAPASTGTNNNLVENYARSLSEVGTDRPSFDRVFAALQNDKLVKLQEAVDVANRYMNDPISGQYVMRFETKRKAFDFIFSTYIERAQEESKLGIIDRMTRWASG